MLIVICGYTATGKDTYQNWLLDRNSNLQRAVSYTTRPIRAGEKEGREYYFTDVDSYLRLEKQGKILSSRFYNTYENDERTIWYYGLPKSEVEKDTNLVTILDHEGAKRVQRKLGRDKVKVVYLYTSSEDILFKRSLRRLDEAKEFKRRLEDDKIKFKGIEETSDLMLLSNGDKELHESNLEKIEAFLEVQ